MSKARRDPKTLRYAARKAREQMRLASGSVLSEWTRLDLLAEGLLAEARNIEKKATK